MADRRPSLTHAPDEIRAVLDNGTVVTLTRNAPPGDGLWSAEPCPGCGIGITIPWDRITSWTALKQENET